LPYYLLIKIMTISLEQYRIKRKQFETARSKRLNGPENHAVIKALVNNRITTEELTRRGLTIDSIEHDLNPRDQKNFSIGDTYLLPIPRGYQQG
jgi:hypothetical protein